MCNVTMLYLKEITAIYLLYYYGVCTCKRINEKKTYFAVERPHIQYVNPKYVSFANVSSRRHSRRDPVHYFNIHVRNLTPWGNNITMHFYFYEFLTNVYKPSFVELHLKFCDLIFKDPIFGATMKRGFQTIKPDISCPIPAGDWDVQNCTLDAAALPNFPFTKGRIYLNMTYSPTGERVGEGYVDFQLKQINIIKA